jgi:hypothetical protein
VVITTKEHEFVDAARTIGLADRRILIRHLLPHTTAPVLVAITLGLAQAIIIESGLSFLGFGVQPPTPSWGGMLQDAQSYLSDCPWIAVFPGLMIFSHGGVLQRAVRLPRRGHQPRPHSRPLASGSRPVHGLTITGCYVILTPLFLPGMCHVLVLAWMFTTT